MTATAPPAAPTFFRFGLPPSLGGEALRASSERLADFLCEALGQEAEVTLASSYEGLAKDLLAGRLDAVWAPPFVCARLEAMGARVLVRGVRQGSSSYRAALLGRSGASLKLDRLEGRRAAWVDRDSVAGYLLPVAHLKAQGLEPARLFAAQHFAGSYRAALEALLAGSADMASIFSPPAASGLGFSAGVEEILPGQSGHFELMAYTDEAPNDGVSVAMELAPQLVHTLEQVLLGLHERPAGAALLRELFHAERFEPSPHMGYRALYRVALASL